ncbi:MAG: ABC-F family ATP-binding cassette domain-containing protein [Bacteroidaceae bacterium]|nr:ABC-F family ATP-binding cassette domain-containing protein [Bacteroidaceae bacterium]
MISIDNLCVEFSARPLFSNVSYVINDRDRIALVGKNGAGKSTMLKIIAGLQEPTSGTVAVPRDTSIAYLPQVMILADNCTVREETEKAFAHIHEIQAELDRLNNLMAERTDYESAEYMHLVECFTHLNEHFQLMGGMNYHAEMERTLQGLGFRREDFDRPTSEFSGGWRMRIELAKLLLQHPDVLLLDEPTNHLDIESIQWLEQFLSTRAGAVVLVSHDRAFINNVTNRTLEISCGKIYDYKVKYDEYVNLRAERREQQLHALENQQKEIAEARAFIERFRYQATKAIQVQQKIRQLEKIVPIEVDEVDNSALRLKFKCSLRSGDYPIICEDVAKTYYGEEMSGDEKEHPVFSGVNLTIKRGEKVAFVGRNGEGKSTLVKCIMGQIPFDGKLTVGHNVQIGYFAQNQAQLLDGEITVFDTIDRVAKGDMRLKIRDILGAFMFGGEASEKKVKFLSGGERTRLAMIKLLLEPVNCLILDEPTNHLDMRSKDVLKDAIRDFEGTVILVSHDREFLDGLVEKVYEFGDGKVREHLGGIYDFLKSKHIEELTELNSSAMSQQKSASNDTNAEGGQKDSALTYEQQKAASRLRKKLEKAVQEAEEKVAQLESAVKILEAQLATPEGSTDMSLYEKHGRLKTQLSVAEEEWEKAMEEFEAL